MIKLDNLPERIKQKIYINKETGCWEWTACTSKKGYGKISENINGKGYTRRAHKFIYEILKHKVPPMMQLDHLCFNKRCVNPDHLEVVTGKENIDRFLNKKGIKRISKKPCLYKNNNKTYNYETIYCGNKELEDLINIDKVSQEKYYDFYNYFVTPEGRKRQAL